MNKKQGKNQGKKLGKKLGDNKNPANNEISQNVASQNVPTNDTPANTTNDIIFSRRLRILRRILGISAAELDARAGFGAGTIGRMERSDQRIYASHLYRIGEVSGVGVDYFYIGLGDDITTEQLAEAEVEYLMNCLEITTNSHIRADAKMVAQIIARELAINTYPEDDPEPGSEEG